MGWSGYAAGEYMTARWACGRVGVGAETVGVVGVALSCELLTKGVIQSEKSEEKNVRNIYFQKLYTL